MMEFSPRPLGAEIERITLVARADPDPGPGAAQTAWRARQRAWIDQVRAITRRREWSDLPRDERQWQAQGEFWADAMEERLRST
jgi:hypothetical protein